MWSRAAANLLRHVFLLTAVVASTSLMAQTAMSRIDIRVSDTYGQSLKTFEVSIIPAGRSKDAVLVVRKAGPISLPFGTYELRATASLHQPAARTIMVDAPSMFVALALSWQDSRLSHVLYTAVRGRVEGVQDAPPAKWIRFVSVFGEFTKESRLGSEGEFEIAGVPYGDYFVVVMDGDKLVHTEKFRKTVREEELTIKLGR